MTPLEKMLVEHEGLCLDLYRDTASPPRWTIGVGRNLSDVGLRDKTEALARPLRCVGVGANRQIAPGCA